LEQLKAEVDQLKKELELKNREIDQLKTDLEMSEESISSYTEEVNRLNDLINSSGKKRAYAKKKDLELKEKEKELRELKNKMGMLRKEKIQMQQQLEKIDRDSKSKGHIIEIKEEEIPVHTLVKDLQKKLTKQRLLIARYEHELSQKSSLEEVELPKPLNGDLGKELTKLKQKLEIKEVELNDLKGKILQQDAEIKELKSTVDQKNKIKNGLEPGPLSKLVKELQEKLNEVKVRNSKLQQQIDEHQTSIKDNGIQNKISTLESELNNKDLKLDELLRQKKNLEVMIRSMEPSKVDQVLAANKKEIQNLTNEIYINRKKIVKLESQLNTKEQMISDLQKTLDQLQEQTKARKIDLQLGGGNKPQELRIRELRTIIETLKKQTKQQRSEITYLRNK